MIEVGAGRRTEDGTLLPMYVEKGNKVMFGAYAGIPQTINGNDCLIIRQDDILLVEVEEEANVAQDTAG